MALSVAVRRGLAFALKSSKAADELCTIIDGQAGGTVSVDTKRRLELAFVDKQTAAQMVTFVQTYQAVAGGNLKNRLGIMIGARYLADELIAANA
jgi:hypothetical protein